MVGYGSRFAFFFLSARKKNIGSLLLRCPTSSSALKSLRHLSTAATRSGRSSRHRRRSHRSQCLHWLQQVSTGHLHLNGFDSRPQPKRKGTPKGTFSFWSRIRESNPPSRLGKPLYYRYTNPALCGYYSKGKWKIQPIFVALFSCKCNLPG